MADTKKNIVGAIKRIRDPLGTRAYEEKEYGLTEKELEKLQDEITRELQLSGKGRLSIWFAEKKLEKQRTKERRSEKKLTMMTAKGRTKQGEALRKLGMERIGRSLDRMFGKADVGDEAKKRRAAQKKLDKMEGGGGGGVFEHGNTEKVIHQVSREVTKLGTKVSRIELGVGTLIAQSQSVSSLSEAVIDIAMDVGDIRTAIMPRDIMAKGRKGTDSEGELQAVRFNPLAPAGNQFRQVSEGGNTTGARIGKDFETSAIMQAAVAASKLVRKEEKREEEKGRLREKYKFRDIEEKEVFATDPINILREDMNENFKKVFDMLKGIDKDGGLLDLAAGAAGMATAGAAGAAAAGAARALLPRILLAAGMAGLPLALMAWIAKEVGEGDINDPNSPVGAIGRTALSISEAFDEWTGRGKRMTEERAEVERKQREGELPMPGNSQSTFDYLSPQADQALANLRLARESADISPEQRTAMDSQISQWEANRDEARARKEYESQYVNTGRIQRVESEADYKARLRALGDIIGQKESGGDYNAYNKGTVGDKMIGADVPIDLSKMTIAEYLRRSELPSSDPSRLFAVGKYQIIPKTMREAVSSLKLNPNTTHLTPRVQDGIFEEYLIGKKRGSIERYLRTGEGREAAELELSKEWAAFGVSQDMRGHKGDIKAGQSYYAGEGGNKASMLASDALDSSVSVTPVARGAALDNDSRTVRNAQSRPSDETSGTTVVPIAMHTTQPIAMPGGRPMLRASPFNRDGSYLAMAHQDSWHPAG